VNLKGRERFGSVEPGQLDAVKMELKTRFEQLKGPDGSSVTDRVWLSEEVFSGDALNGAPDLLPVLKDHRYELDDEIFHTSAFTDYRHLPRGVHHPDGIGIVAGLGVDSASPLDASVLDVTPTLLYLAGLKVPEGLDGRVVSQAFARETLELRPVEMIRPLAGARSDENSPYSPEEEAQIEESLRGLGYL
jgi:predicted AlkP superfamily phosphohydrolase/phosphomutase